MGVPGSRVGLVLLLAVAVRLAGALCRSGPLAETRLHGPVHAGEQRRLPGAGRPAPTVLICESMVGGWSAGAGTPHGGRCQRHARFGMLRTVSAPHPCE